MNALEERSKEFVRKLYTNGAEWWKDSTSTIMFGEICYEHAAAEQHQIDINKACDYFCKKCPTRLYIMSGMADECDKSTCSFLNNIKKAMEE